MYSFVEHTSEFLSVLLFLRHMMCIGKVLYVNVQTVGHPPSRVRAQVILVNTLYKRLLAVLFRELFDTTAS